MIQSGFGSETLVINIISGTVGRERRPVGGDEAPAHCCRLTECHQTAQEVQSGDFTSSLSQL
jgi:hypothetical protein